MALVFEKIDVLNNKSQRKRFIDFQFSLYKKDPHWVPQLRMEIEKMLEPKHPFYPSSECGFWMAVRDGKDVGRIMAVINNRYNEFHKTSEGHYGFFEAIDDQEVISGLFDSAKEWLKSQGMNKMVGPFNLSTNYESGSLVDGYNERPVLMMTYNPEYYNTNLEKLGFKKAKDLLAYHMKLDFEMPEVIQKIAKRAEASNKITYRTINKKDWDNEVNLMYEIYNDAWEDNWGFVPMTREEFDATAEGLKMIADENLILFALVDGEAAGFIVTLPDFNQVLHKIPNGKLLPFGIFKVLMKNKYIDTVRVPTMGVKAKYRKLGLASILYQRCHQNLLKYKNYKFVEMSWILEDNINMNKPLIRMGATPYRTYRIYQKDI